jgi:general stress protein YciG
MDQNRPVKKRTTAETNKRKYGEDFYAKIGAKGGRKSRNNLSSDRARELGRKGGEATNAKEVTNEA